MKIRRMVLLIIFTLLCCSCGSGGIKSSSYSKDYIPEEDFNPSAQSWMNTNIYMASMDKGLYFVAGDYAFYLDYSTMKAHVLCSKTDCLHYEETDERKTLYCDGFIRSTVNPGVFVGCYKEKVYMTSINENLEMDLVEMKADGSSRKVIISNLQEKKAQRLLMHRGVIYYTVESVDLEGERKSALMAASLLSGNKEPTAVYEAPANSFLTQVFPLRDQVFFCENRYKEGTSDILYSLVKYDISTQKTERITDEGEGSWLIFGVRDNRVLLMHGSDKLFYEYSLEDGKLRETDSGIAAFASEHPDWICQAECVSEDMNVFSCFDVEKNDYVTDLYVTDASGKVLSVIPQEAWAFFTAEMITINGEEYMARFSRSYQPFSFKLYKKQDLQNGIVDPLTILEVEDINKDLTKGIIKQQH